MTCAFSREALALYVENDLPNLQTRTTETHLHHCAECREFCDRLARSQNVLKTLRQSTASAADITSVRGQVLTRIESPADALGWRLRLERFVFARLPGRAYAYAAAAILTIVSASLLAQIRPGEPGRVVAAAMFDSGDRLIRPGDYRKWIAGAVSFDASRAGFPDHAAMRGPDGALSQNIYIEPAAYRTFLSTGRFPEGTVLVLESTNAERHVVDLNVSVKDGRFYGGWGYFGFVDHDGELQPKSQAVAESAGCRGCHEARAETDHVFTQFYSMLKVRRI